MPVKLILIPVTMKRIYHKGVAIKMYPVEVHNKVVASLEERLNYYETLVRYTNKTTKLNDHKAGVRFMKEVIQQANEEYEMYKHD